MAEASTHTKSFLQESMLFSIDDDDLLENTKPSLISSSLSDSCSSHSSTQENEELHANLGMKELNSSADSIMFFVDAPLKDICEAAAKVTQGGAQAAQESKSHTDLSSVVSDDTSVSEKAKEGNTIQERKCQSLHDLRRLSSAAVRYKSHASLEIAKSQSLLTVSSVPKSRDSGFTRSLSCSSLNSGAKVYDHVQSKVKTYIKQIKEEDAARKKEKFENVRDRQKLASKHESENVETLQDIISRLELDLEERNDMLKEMQGKYNSLLLKYAEAENKIDKLRFRASLTSEPVERASPVPRCQYSSITSSFESRRKDKCFRKHPELKKEMGSHEEQQHFSVCDDDSSHLTSEVATDCCSLSELSEGVWGKKAEPKHGIGQMHVQAQERERPDGKRTEETFHTMSNQGDCEDDKAETTDCPQAGCKPLAGCSANSSKSVTKVNTTCEKRPGPLVSDNTHHSVFPFPREGDTGVCTERSEYQALPHSLDHGLRKGLHCNLPEDCIVKVRRWQESLPPSQAVYPGNPLGTAGERRISPDHQLNAEERVFHCHSEMCNCTTKFNLLKCADINCRVNILRSCDQPEVVSMSHTNPPQQARVHVNDVDLVVKKQSLLSLQENNLCTNDPPELSRLCFNVCECWQEGFYKPKMIPAHYIHSHYTAAPSEGSVPPLDLDMLQRESTPRTSWPGNIHCGDSKKCCNQCGFHREHARDDLFISDRHTVDPKLSPLKRKRMRSKHKSRVEHYSQAHDTRRKDSKFSQISIDSSTSYKSIKLNTPNLEAASGGKDETLSSFLSNLCSSAATHCDMQRKEEGSHRRVGHRTRHLLLKLLQNMEKLPHNCCLCRQTDPACMDIPGEDHGNPPYADGVTCKSRTQMSASSCSMTDRDKEMKLKLLSSLDKADVCAQQINAHSDAVMQYLRVRLGVSGLDDTA